MPELGQPNKLYVNKQKKEILNSYEEKYGELPKNIVIHRDGFSRESLNWYEEYFGKYNINFNTFCIICQR